MSSKNETIAAELRANRGRKGLNQSDLSKITGFNPATISAWENRGGISLENAWQLADLYGVSLDDLAGRKFATEQA